MQEITENNKLLALFLGWKNKWKIINSQGMLYEFHLPEEVVLYGESDREYCYNCGRDSYRMDFCFKEDLIFHRDWNWLMMVVSKIEDIIYESEDIHNFMFTSDIGETYKACVEFVKLQDIKSKL